MEAPTHAACGGATPGMGIISGQWEGSWAAMLALNLVAPFPIFHLQRIMLKFNIVPVKMETK